MRRTDLAPFFTLNLLYKWYTYCCSWCALTITTHTETEYNEKELRTEMNFYFTRQIQLSKSVTVIKERSFLF